MGKKHPEPLHFYIINGFNGIVSALKMFFAYGYEIHIVLEMLFLNTLDEQDFGKLYKRLKVEVLLTSTSSLVPLLKS